MKLEDVIRELNAGNKWAPLNPETFSEDQLTAFCEFGNHAHTFGGLTGEQIQRRFDEVRNWMRFVDGGRVNAVYLDTTTLHTVEELVLNKRSQYLNPATLLDLSNFVNCAVLYDRVFHLENPHVDSYRFNEALGNQPVVIPLPVRTFDGGYHGDTVHSLGGILRGIWYRTIQYVQHLRFDVNTPWGPFSEDAQEIREGWRLLLNFEGSINEFDSSVLTQWESDGPRLLEDLVQVGNWFQEDRRLRGGTLDHRQASELVSECNYRCLFNQMVSYFLKLHYIPNSFRMPFRRFLYKRARVVQDQLPSIKAIEYEYQRIADLYFASENDNLRLPFFLSSVLSDVSSLDEFFEVLTETRHKASTFRQRRAEFDEALHMGNVTVAARLRQAMQVESSNLCRSFSYAPIAGVTAAVLAAVSSATTPIMVASIAILTAASRFPPEQVRKLKERVLFPQYWFLADLKDAAIELTNAYPKVCSLWGLRERDQDVFARHFARLRELGY